MGNLMKKLYLYMGVMLLSLVLVQCTSVTVSHAKSYYVSPSGSDSNSGTLSTPFESITKAQEVASSGDTVYLRGGTYKKFTISNSDNIYNYVHEITKSGITYTAYSSEIPVFDFSNISTDKRVAAFHIGKSASNVNFSKITIIGVPVGSQKQSECFRIEGNATFNQVACHDNEAIGFYFTSNGKGSCIKCDSYNNIGPTSASIGNTDGFGAHGAGVTFKDCRAWNCSDDGYDCISSKGSNTFDNCWAYNMNAGGDSNGFKIGGYGTGKPGEIVPVHIVKNCLSANNKAHGFYANHQPGQSATWTNNTAYNNAGGNFNMLERVSITNATDIPGTREVVHDNLAFKRNIIDQSNLPLENVTNNSWNKSGISVTAEDFQSLDASQMTETRGADGSLPDIKFMKPASGSDVEGLGCFK